MQEKKDEQLEEEVQENIEVDESELELDEVQELKEQIAKLEDSHLRDMAEFENIKKRTQKEKEQAIAYAHERFARDLLSVIDSLESANVAIDSQEQVGEESIKQLAEGIDLTIDQFKKVFEKHGISLVDIESGFDPHFHEAVMKVDSEEHESGQIVQVLQKGYKIKDRVLRPAMVSVSK